jgi:hypothetical protein
MENLPEQGVSSEREAKIANIYDEAVTYIDSSNADSDIKDQLKENLELWRTLRSQGKQNVIMGLSLIEATIQSRAINRRENNDLLLAVKRVLD